MIILEVPTHEDLKALLKVSEITRQEACGFLYVSIHTMDSWCAPDTSKKHNDMPLAMWELLLLKLNEHPLKIVVDR